MGGRPADVRPAQRRTSHRTARLLEPFQQAGLTAEAHADIRPAVWGKLAAISAVGMLAIARRPLGPLLARPERRAFVRDTVAEAVAVGRAAGVMLPEDYPQRVMAPAGDGQGTDRHSSPVTSVRTPGPVSPAPHVARSGKVQHD